MYIHEAIKARTADKPFITRQSWIEEMGPYANKTAKILPTSSLDCCVITAFSEKKPCRGWQPSGTDLTADDWVTIR